MADLGKKHECSECGAKFYDLGKADPICPRCGTSVSGEDDEPKVKSKRKRKTVPVAATPKEPDEDLSAAGDDDFAADDDIEEEDLEDEDLEDLDDDEEEEDDDLED